MANDRNDYRGDYGRDRDRGDNYGSRHDHDYSGARNYRDSEGSRGRDDRNFRGGGTGYGDHGYRPDVQGGRETFPRQDYYGGRQPAGGSSHGQQDFGQGHGGRFAEPGAQNYAGRDRGQQPDRGGHDRQPQGYDH